MKRALVCFTLLVGLAAAGQQTAPERGDTLDIYRKIKKLAYKSRVTKLVYHSIFVDPAPRVYEVKPLSDKQKKEDPVQKYKGKVIQNIYIEVLDPFGYSIHDTLKRKTYPLQELGNRYHVTTRHRIIRNMLLFEEEDTLDPLKISESERLLRAAD